MSHAVLDALDTLAGSIRAGADRRSLGLQVSQLRGLAASEAEVSAALEAKVARYQTVLSRALEVAATTGLGPVAGKVVDGMLEVANARRGFLGLLGEGGGWDILVARNLNKDDLADPRRLVSTSVLTEMLRTGSPVISDDASQEDSLAHAASVQEMRLRSVACLPLVWEARMVGFVYLDDVRARGRFDDAALIAIRAWLPLAAESVARAMAIEGAGPGPLGIATRSERMRADLEQLARVAGFDVSILLTGETGTGKSMLARRVHDASPRATMPFLHINCGAVPESLLEAELFGAEAGAFTGAKGRRIGRFEAAEGGTLFLDELDTLPLACQVKLLVALQDRVITRLGSNTPIRCDVRVLAAMSAEPGRAIAEGRLREDLYYRLSVIEVRLLPLRQRREDIPLIARGVLESTRRRYGLSPLSLGDRALTQLLAHDWPGNVRELQNALDRAALLSRDGLIEEIRPQSTGRPPEDEPNTPGPSGLTHLMISAARRYVDEVARNPRLRGLDLIDGFRGLVVSEAIRRFGGRDEAFRAFGEDGLVENRNHHRVIRRELERWEELEERLTSPRPPGENP